MDKIEVFNKGKLYFTADGHAVITGPLLHNLHLNDAFIRKEMPSARVFTVPTEAFLRLQNAADKKGDYSLNHILNSYFR